MRDKAILKVTMLKDDYKNNYTLRARIGSRIAQLLGIIEITLTDKYDKKD